MEFDKDNDKHCEWFFKNLLDVYPVKNGTVERFEITLIAINGFYYPKIGIARALDSWLYTRQKHSPPQVACCSFAYGERWMNLFKHIFRDGRSICDAYFYKNRYTSSYVNLIKIGDTVEELLIDIDLYGGRDEQEEYSSCC